MWYNFTRMSKENGVENSIEVFRKALPDNVYDQIRDLPEFAKREAICEELFGMVYSILDSEGIEIDLDKSGYRAKTDARIMQKIDERKSFFFLRDVFGLWVVVKNDCDRARIPGIIKDAFKETPENFADGTPSVRDYSIPDIRVSNRSRNKNISEEYSALHINGIFDYGGNRLGIFELKAFNENEERLFELTRQKYETNRRNGNGNKINS